MTVPAYQSFAEAKVVQDSADQVTVAKPAGVVENDLMVSVIVTDQDATAITCTGWTAAIESYTLSVSVAVLYKVAGASEGSDYTFSWTGNQSAYAFIMRITGHKVATPINVSSIDGATSASPTCPTATTTKDDCLILRIFGADDDDITVDGGEPSGTTVITVDESAASGTTVSGGAAYESQLSAGATGAAAFALTASEQWVAATVAIESTDAVSSSISASPSASPSVSASISASLSASISASVSASPSISASISASVSASPSISASVSASLSASVSTSVSASLSASISASVSASVSSSISASPSISASLSASISSSISASGSVSSSISASLSASPSISASVSASISTSISASFSASPSVIDGSGYGAYVSGGTVQWVENTFTNLGHLIGETVKIQGTTVGDVTSEYDDEVVDANGDITIQDGATKNWVRKAVAGLPYRYTLRPMRFAVATREGAIQSSVANIHKIIASFYNSLGVQYGDSLSNLHDINFPSSTALNTGDVELPFEGGFSTENDIYISGNGCFPCTLRAIIARAEKTGQ